MSFYTSLNTRPYPPYTLEVSDCIGILKYFEMKVESSMWHFYVVACALFTLNNEGRYLSLPCIAY